MGLVMSIVLLPSFVGGSYDPSRFEKEVLVSSSNDALQIEVLPNGDILFIEFRGAVKRWHARSGEVTQLGRIKTHAKGEVGLLGMAVAKDFMDTGHLYALFCPEDNPSTMRVSLFTVRDAEMASDSEVELLSWSYDDEYVYHIGGAMWMDGKGDLYIGSGDNCHYSPGLPVDMRPGRKHWDAYRSSANSRDYRGKILRIHPEPNGSYTIPENNLFPAGKDGLPEIFAMGLRNPFRISVDDESGMLFIGDVGPNILPELGITPVGYDELNATSTACNFGWPAFVGPNEALPVWDFDKNEEIRRSDPESPENVSPNNTGIRNLPPATPPLIWYPNVVSERFPSLGSGGRSIMAGPVYHYNEANPSTTKLPQELDGRLFIYEWMRNWTQTVRLDSEGPEVEPFALSASLRRPIDLKIGPDGALYIIEYGDQWWENLDSRIVRVVYRRGNRAPVARMTASETAGRQPLNIHFDAAGTIDADGDTLRYYWSIDGRAVGSEKTFSHNFADPGSYEVGLTALDPGAAQHTTTQTIQVGNARPRLSFREPTHGSFFDWDKEITYQVEVEDEDSSQVDPAVISVLGEYRNRFYGAEDGESFVHPGLTLMRQSTCFSCHLTGTASAGPAYDQVAAKYADDSLAAETLAQRILSGGSGLWGELAMPPHPQHTIDQTRQMVSWILSLNLESINAPKLGAQGTWMPPARADSKNWTVPPKPGEGIRTEGGVFVLTAEYTDKGSDAAAPLRGEAAIVLHSRKKKAALYDLSSGMEYVERVEGEMGIVGYFEDGDYIVWRDMNLDSAHAIRVRAGSLSKSNGWIELRDGSPDGALLARIDISPTGDGEFGEAETTLSGQSGLTDVYVVGRFSDPEGQVLGLNWIEFQ